MNYIKPSVDTLCAAINAVEDKGDVNYGRIWAESDWGECLKGCPYVCGMPIEILPQTGNRVWLVPSATTESMFEQTLEVNLNFGMRNAVVALLRSGRISLRASSSIFHWFSAATLTFNDEDAYDELVAAVKMSDWNGSYSLAPKKLVINFSDGCATMYSPDATSKNDVITYAHESFGMGVDANKLRQHINELSKQAEKLEARLNYYEKLIKDDTSKD